MKKFMLLALSLCMLSFSADAQFGKYLEKGKAILGGGDVDDNTTSALKEALNIGVEDAVKSLAVDNGYLESPYKILIPEDAQSIINKVKIVPGFQDVEEKLIAQMNKAAEISAKKATPIFIGAIKDMSVKDGVSILMGDQHAATDYLEGSTRKALYSEFNPIIRESLEEVNALTYWKSVVSAYNKIPFVKKKNAELDDHVNNKALDGLFGLIATKEEGIRGDSSQRTTDLLKSVFAKQDEKN